MKKIFLIIFLYILLLPLVNASNIEKITLNQPHLFEYFTNTKISIPEKTNIISHTLSFLKEQTDKNLIITEKNKLLQNFKNKYGEKKINDFLDKNTLFIIGNELRKNLFWSGNSIITPQKYTSVIHKITFDTNSDEDITLKVFPIDSTNINWYINPSNNWFAKIFLFDDILLPQNMKWFYNYSSYSSKDGNYVTNNQQEVKITKKYKKVQFKHNESNHYAIVPYFEIKIPTSLSAWNKNDVVKEKDTLELEYTIIDDLYFWNTTIEVTNNWQQKSFIEYIRH